MVCSLHFCYYMSVKDQNAVRHLQHRLSEYESTVACHTYFLQMYCYRVRYVMCCSTLSTDRSNAYPVSPDLVEEGKVLDNFPDSCMSAFCIHVVDFLLSTEYSYLSFMGICVILPSMI
jgi:hypothetical protein